MTSKLSISYQQLKEQTEAALISNRAKSEFLSKMSHELRTPLNGILGYAQILQREKALTPEQASGLNIIIECGNHLLNLINDILDLAKIEAEKLEIYPHEIHFPQFLDAIVGIIKIKAQEQNILFHYQPEPDLPIAIKADEKRLRQILLNLLSNAVKFTPEGQVIFRVSSVVTNSLETNNNTERIIRFEIEDTGVGISSQELEQIFKPFEQVGNLNNRLEGTGLGLTITKHLVGRVLTL